MTRLSIRRTDRILSRLPDPDDALRRLADVLRMPESCRRRACRREGACQGGFGPPCYLAARDAFADGVGGRMREIREHWSRERDALRALLRRRPGAAPLAPPER
jgi:hypothetical protein